MISGAYSKAGGRVFSLIVLIVLLLQSGEVLAQVTNNGILDDVLQRYRSQASTWVTKIETAATWLFWTLSTITLAWTLCQMALKRAETGDIFAELIRWIMTTGFFWWLLTNGPVFAGKIIQSMQQLGASASGLPHEMSPSSVVDIGFKIFFAVVDHSSIWEPTDSLFGLLLGIAILLVLALTGINMMMLIIASYFLVYGGVIFLGFGGSRWTSEMAINYFKTSLGIGASIFAMILCIGIGMSFLDNYFASFSTGPRLKEMAVMAVVAVALFVTCNKIPPMMASLVGMGGQGASGIGSFGAGTALAAAGMATAGMAAAGAGLMAGAASAAGGASALSAALSGARASVSAGVDTLSKMSGSGGSGGGSGDGSPLDKAAGLSAGGQGAASGQSAAGGQDQADAGGQSAASGQDQADAGDQSAASGQDQADAGGQSAVSGLNQADVGDQGAASGLNQADAGDQSAASGQDQADAGDQSAASGQDQTDAGDQGRGNAKDQTAGEARQAHEGETGQQQEAAASPPPWPFPTAASVAAAKAAAKPPSGRSRLRQLTKAATEPMRQAAGISAGIVNHNLGTGGKVAVETGFNLARGMGSLMKEKVVAKKSRADTQINSTAGGRLAAAIKANVASVNAQPSQPPATTFAGNSLGGVINTPERAAEVDSFVNEGNRTEES